MSDAEGRRMLATALPSSPQARAAREGIRVRVRFNALYTQLGLSAKEIARFEAAVTEKPGGASVFNWTLGMYPEQEERSYLESSVKSLEATVRDTLGESAVASVRDFVATADLRDIADKLAVHTFYTDTPLTAAQSDQLVQIFRECSSDTSQPVRLNPDSVDWAAALQRAGSFLSPAQMTTLRAVLDFQAFDQEFKRSTGLPYRRPIRNF